MTKESNPFVPKYSKENNNFPYLGSDGLPLEVSYTLYLRKCEEFKFKARKYAKDNLSLKNSVLHHTKLGYEPSDELEKEVLQERDEHMKNYKTVFNQSSFDADPNSMYNCFTGKSKKIRIIRELNEKRNEEFTDFNKKTGSWFTRYCTLSRFIQAARKIIILNRLKRVLGVLKTVTPEMIREIESRDSKNRSKSGIQND